jgi:leucine-rich repeat protein SHOC2
METSNLDRTIERSIANNAYQLSLFRNRSSTLPDRIGDITSLEMLYLSRNRLEQLPESIGNLSNLVELNLSHNRLASLPESMRKLSNLEKLYLQDNQFTNLPTSLSSLTSLTDLNFANNQLNSLPEWIGGLSSLRTLNLSGNSLTDLSILQSLPSLTSVQFFNVNLPRQYWIKFSEWQPMWILFERNSEVIRTLVEHVGYEKICEKLLAYPVNTWREYTLLEINFGEPIKLLKMACPSTAHVHILRVPPQMTSAEDAITWVNHGIHPDRFSVQT